MAFRNRTQTTLGALILPTITYLSKYFTLFYFRSCLIILFSIVIFFVVSGSYFFLRFSTNMGILVARKLQLSSITELYKNVQLNGRNELSALNSRQIWGNIYHSIFILLSALLISSGLKLFLFSSKSPSLLVCLPHQQLRLSLLCHFVTSPLHVYVQFLHY